MTITSFPFAVSVLVVLGLYFLLPRRGQLWLLLAASYAFYSSWSWQFPVGLLALTVVNYLIARRLWKGAGKFWLWGGILTNVLALGLLKYADFFLSDLMRALDLRYGDGLSLAPKILLPIGLSYRVLENISFLLDVSRRQLDRFPGLRDYALYVAYFPKLLSGPIERGKGFLNQLPQGRVIDNGALARGFTLIIVGAVRKLVLADLIRSLMPAGFFERPSEHLGIQLVVPMVAAVFVVYNDFAGYTDMVRGISALFGIELTRNFSAPFFSRNFSELWLRWHSSLSSWLRDYIFLPASRSLLRRGVRADAPLNLILPPLLAMLVSALWHEVSLHILLWGALWGVFLILGRIPGLRGPIVSPDRQPRWRQGLGMVRVAALLAFSNLLFQMDLPRTSDFLTILFHRPFVSAKLLSMSGLMLVSLFIDLVQHRSQDEIVFLHWRPWVRSMALAAALLALFLATRLTIPEPFIYQNF